MGINATVNGEPISTIEAICYVALWLVPWLYGVWAMIGKLVDGVIEPGLERFVKWMIKD